jgi:hypothetical protein
LNFFLQWANQIGLLQKQKNVGLVRHPQFRLFFARTHTTLFHT